MRSIPKLVFIPSTACNLACDYCFSRHEGARMPAGLVERVAAEYAGLAVAAGATSADVFWQGGEVLSLGMDWVRGAHAAFTVAFEGRGCEVRHHLQTNLVAYDERWNDILRDLFGGRVGTSCDYPNAGRRTHRGSPSDFTTRWLDRVRLLRASGFRGGTIAVLNDRSVAVPPEEFLGFFFEVAGIDGLQLNLPFPPRHAPRMLDAFGALVESGAVARFLVDLFGCWWERYRPAGKGLYPFSALVERLAGGAGRVPLWCQWSVDCTQEIVSVGPDGVVGPCDCWVTSYPERCYGHIDAGGLAARLRSRSRRALAGRTSRLVGGRCGECEFLAVCFGGCPVRALAWTGDPLAQDPYCATWHELFTRVRDLVRDPVAAGGGPRP